MTITVKGKFFKLEFFIFLLNKFWCKNFKGKTNNWGKKMKFGVNFFLRQKKINFG
jgi:hypothetical protein